MKITLPNILLICILLLAFFIRFYNLELRLPFGWDQARDAEAVWRILREGKLTLIGPRVVSDDAFFLGPFWFYFLTPFYFLFNMDPLGLGAVVLILGVVTTFIIYLFLKKIAGIKTALIGAFLWALVPDVTVWNPMLIPPFVIGILFSLIKIIEGEKRFIILTLFLLGLGLQLHFQMVFLFIPFIFSMYFLFRQKRTIPLKELLLGVGLFAATFLPLYIFDLRHDFLNFKGFLKLFAIGATAPQGPNFLAHFQAVFAKFASTTYFFLPTLIGPKLLLGLSFLILSVLGLVLQSISIQKKVIFLSIIAAPVVFFSLYKGDISEYYFALTSIPILFGLTFLLSKVFESSFLGKALVILFLIYAAFLNIKHVLRYRDLTSLYYQKQAILYLKEQKVDKIINVSYDVPRDSDSGFKYLLKHYNVKAQNIPEGHLWTIVIPGHDFGNIGVVRK